MRFRHSPEIWAAHPELVAGVIAVDGVTTRVSVNDRFEAYQDSAIRRLAEQTPSQYPQIQAWRRAFAAMGLKPTQYRCASESLLRRIDKHGELPRIHPLVDLCNAVSANAAIPVAVIDRRNVTGNLEVRYAQGDEEYESFAGDIEHLTAGEVIFADDARQAHARRWTHKQSSRSAVRADTVDVLIVAEALHDEADRHISELIATLEQDISRIWATVPRRAILTAKHPDFDVDRTAAGRSS